MAIIWNHKPINGWPYFIDYFSDAIEKGRAVYYTLIPMVFLLFMTLIALIVNLKAFYLKGDYLLLGLDIIILVATILVCLNALKHSKRTGVIKQ